MWTDATADDTHCPGSGAPGIAADPLEDGYPHGRALCDVCLRFIEMDAGRLIPHETSDPRETPDERRRRMEWLNTHGW